MTLKKILCIQFLLLFCKGVFAEELALEKKILAPRELTTEDIEAFFDGMVPLQIETADVARFGVIYNSIKSGFDGHAWF